MLKGIKATLPNGFSLVVDIVRDTSNNYFNKVISNWKEYYNNLGVNAILEEVEVSKSLAEHYDSRAISMHGCPFIGLLSRDWKLDVAESYIEIKEEAI